MPWEWVAPVATAGAGSVGIFFTWLTGKQARKAESDRQQVRDTVESDRIKREEKQSAYVLALRSLTDIDDGLRAYFRQRGIANYEARTQQFTVVLATASREFWSLKLVAPDQIAQEFGRIIMSAEEALKVIDETGQMKQTENAKDLTEMMARDLGYGS